MENIPEELATLLRSCWSENPALRPEFMEITKYLKEYLYSLWPADMTPPKVMEIEDAQNKTGEDFKGSGHVTKKSDERAKKQKSSSPSFLVCFDNCLSE